MISLFCGSIRKIAQGQAGTKSVLAYQFINGLAENVKRIDKLINDQRDGWKLSEFRFFNLLHF